MTQACCRTHLDDLGVEEGGVDGHGQVEEVHAVAHWGILALVPRAPHAGRVAQVVGVAAPRVHPVAHRHRHLSVKP